MCRNMRTTGNGRTQPGDGRIRRNGRDIFEDPIRVGKPCQVLRRVGGERLLIDATERHDVGGLDEFEVGEILLGIGRNERVEARRRASGRVWRICRGIDRIPEDIIEVEARCARVSHDECPTGQLRHAADVGDIDPVAIIQRFHQPIREREGRALAGSAGRCLRNRVRGKVVYAPTVLIETARGANRGVLKLAPVPIPVVVA